VTAAWMLYATVVATCLGLAAGALDRGFRRTRHATRWVWAVSLLQSVVLVAAAYFTAHTGVLGNGHEAPLGTTPVGSVLGSPSFDASTGWVLNVPTWWSALDVPLLVFWCGATLTLGGVFVAAAVRFRQEARGWPEWTFDGERVRLAPNVGPGVFGLWRPSVVMPAWVGEFDRRASRLMLAHELEHVRARDIWLSHFALLVVALAPWNVAVWWQARRLRDAIEVDCDRRVLARGVDRHEYGALLVRICQRSVGRRFLIAAMSAPRSQLGRRIAVMTASSADRLRWPGALGLCAAAAALVVASCETPTPPSQLGDASRAPFDTALVQVGRPERISSPVPRYPELLRQAGVEGSVVLSFVVAEDGSVDASSIRIVEATNGAFVGPAREVILGSRFEPGYADGNPIAMEVSQTVTFELQGNKEAPVVQETVRRVGESPPAIYLDGILVEQADGESAGTMKKRTRLREVGESNVMILIDGQVVDGNVEEALAGLTPDRIARVEVIKGEAAVGQFGERARHGVVSVYTKDMPR
jgi:TonB family protein